MTPAVRRGIKAARAVVVAAVCSSCAATTLKVPAGPSVPASDGDTVLEQATAACRAVSTITMEMAVRGSVRGERVRGRLSAGFAAPAFARIEAVASFGQPAFFFVARDYNDATLFIPRERRVARGRASELLDAVTGVSLNPAALRFVVTGCAAGGVALGGAAAIGRDWRAINVGPGDRGMAYAHRASDTAPWQVVGLSDVRSPDGWRADYSSFDRGLPRAIHLVSSPPGRFDLQLELSQVDINTPLGAEAFQLEVPPSAQTISIGELRRSGVLGGK